MKSIHPATYFAMIGTIGAADHTAAIEFARERSSLYTFNRDLFVKRMANTQYMFNAAGAASFIDWVFEVGLQGESRIAAFIKAVCRRTGETMAHRQLRTYLNYREAIVYHADVLGSLLSTMLYGGAEIRVVRAETVEIGSDYSDPFYRLKNNRWVPAHNMRPTMVINGMFKCWYRDAIMFGWPVIQSGYVGLTPSSNGVIYKLGARTIGKGRNRQFVQSMSYWHFCRAIVSSRALMLDMGHEFASGYDKHVTELRDSRNSRRGIFGYWSLDHLIDHAKKSGEFTALEILIIKVIYGLENGNFADSMNMSKRTWARYKQHVGTRFTEWARRQIE